MLDTSRLIADAKLSTLAFVVALAGTLWAALTWVTVLLLPDATPTSLGLIAVFAIAFSGLALWILLDRARTATVSTWLALLVMSGVIVRIAQLTLGPAAADPSLPTFMPVYAYVPVAWVIVCLLCTVRVAWAVCVLSWVLCGVLAVPGAIVDAQAADGVRRGAEQLVGFLLLGAPLLLVFLYALLRWRTRGGRA